MDERSLKKYCRRAASQLECGRAQRETFRNFIRASAGDYWEQQPDAPFAEVEAALGHPEEAAREFMAALPEGTADRWRKARRKRNILCIAAAGVLIAVLAAMVIWYIAVKGVYTAKPTITYYEMSENMTPEEVFAAMPTAAPIEN